MTAALHVVIAATQAQTRESLCAAAVRAGYRVRGLACTADEVRALCGDSRPDVLIVDAGLLRAVQSQHGDRPRWALQVPLVLAAPATAADLAETASCTDVLTCVPTPVTEAGLTTAVCLARHLFRRRQRLFAQTRRLKQELDLTEAVAKTRIRGKDGPREEVAAPS